jgi:nitrous oxidase accessory protein NosD
MKGLKGLSLLLLASVGVLLLVGVAAGDAEGATIVVPDDYQYVHEAIDNATDFDTIFIRDGVYNETVVVWRPLTIMGESRDGTILENGEDMTILVVSQRVHLSNITVRNHSDFTFAYIHQGSACTVEDVVVRDSGNGLWVNRAHNNVFRRVGCLDNHETGLWLDEAGNNVFIDVVSTGNGIDGGRDHWGYQNTFDSCVFSGNGGHGFATHRGVTGSPTVGLTLRDCVISNNSQSGCDLYYSDHMTLVGCKVEDNAWTAVRVDYSNDTLISGCTVSNFTRFGIAYVGRNLATGCVIRDTKVFDTDTSWSVVMARDSRDCLIEDNVITCVNRALSLYSMNDTVARGNVLVGTNDNASLVTKGLAVGVPGNGAGDPCHNVNVTDCIVSGFTTGIEVNAGSRIFIRGCSVSECSGDGIMMDATEYMHQPMEGGAIEDCVLDGCGMYIEGMTGAVVRDNTIQGAVDGIFLNATTLPIRDNVFRENEVTDCTGWGLRFNMTNGTNRFHLNTFINNTEHSNLPVDTDAFDDGSMYGNYWDDYQERYPDAVVVGRVWDTPYAVGGGTLTFDRYPLAFPYDTTPPVADAGEQQGGDAGSTYRLNGTGSWDDGTIVRWTWTFTYADTPVSLEGEVATFPFLLIGSYQVTLEVEDAWGNTDTNTTMVHIHDLTDPMADAGDDVRVGMGEAFTLDGTGSTDNGIIVTWEWHVDPEGIDRVLAGTLVEWTIDEPGEYPVVLRVTDEGGNADVDDVTVTVVDTGPPVADAGRDFTVDQGATVTLSGRWSTDNVAVTSWTWTFTEDGVVVIEVGSSVDRVFPLPGVYEVYLNVTDDAGNWDVDTFTLTVRDTEPPVADAGVDVRVDQGTLVTLDGTGSTDNVAITGFNWIFAEGSVIKDLVGAEPSYRFDEAGEFELELQAYDAAGNVGLDWVIVTVTPVEGEREWTLGPFRDTDGALGGVRVEVTMNGTPYVAYTGDGGNAVFLVAVDDLVPPVSVVAEKEGWETLEFDVELDSGGDATGSVPQMKREKDGGGDDDDEDEEIDWLAWGLVIVLIIAFAGTLLYLSAAAKRADEG